MRVLMSAAAGPTAPGIVRHLKSLGHFVIGHDCNKDGAGAAMCDEFRQSPRVIDDPRGYIALIRSIEHDVYLARIDEELRYCAVSPLHAATTRIFTSKIAQQSALWDAGLPVAPRARPGDVAIMKPDRGRGSRVTTLPPYVRVPGEYLYQRKIEGMEYTVDILADMKGEFLCAVPRQRIEKSSVSLVGKVVLEQDMIDLAKRLVSLFTFAGPINMQAIRDERGEIFITEVNPRISGSCMFTVLAGFDILQQTCRLHQGLPFEPPTAMREIMVRRYFVEEVADAMDIAAVGEPHDDRQDDAAPPETARVDPGEGGANAGA